MLSACPHETIERRRAMRHIHAQQCRIPAADQRRRADELQRRLTVSEGI